MKKLFVAAAVSLFTLSAMAAETAYVKVTLKSASGSTNAVKLAEDDANTNEYEDGADADKMMSYANSKSVLIYGIVGTHKCDNVVALNLDGTQLGFSTNNVDDTYTLSFSNFSGRELKLYDAVKDTVITINATTVDYTFTVDASLVGRQLIENRFSIGEPAPVPYEICHRYGKLQVSGYQGGTVIVKDANGDEKINVVVPTRVQYDIDLKDDAGAPLEDGNYTVEANGETLIIKVGN